MSVGFVFNFFYKRQRQEDLDREADLVAKESKYDLLEINTLPKELIMMQILVRVPKENPDWTLFQGNGTKSRSGKIRAFSNVTDCEHNLIQCQAIN